VRVIGERARDLLHRVTSFARGFGRGVRDLAADSALAAADRIRTTAHGDMERLEDTVRQRPLTAVAIALGAGYLLSLLLHLR
jgi:ElaB/YqjD/DUF883 family membrane-anchored ribosome-binding protein